jgi:REP element-mobilizing transposase RayT
MANSFSKIIIHYIFSTKNREPFITSDLAEKLWKFIGGIAKQNQMISYAVGGTADHAHVCISILPTMSVSRAVQIIKGESSYMVHENFPHLKNFRWQTGYAAFGVSKSNLERTVSYILNQELHHQRMTFEKEYREFLDRYHVKYNEKYLWG